MKTRICMIALLAAALLPLGTNSAHAQCGVGGFGYNAWDVGRLYDVLSRNVPHFAAFPPVYYSAPVPRTYGYSPFAYPPGTMTPEVVETVSAQEIINPYVVPASIEKEVAAEDKVAQTPDRTEPLVVLNPYVRTNFAELSAFHPPSSQE